MEEEIAQVRFCFSSDGKTAVISDLGFLTGFRVCGEDVVACANVILLNLVLYEQTNACIFIGIEFNNLRISF